MKALPSEADIESWTQIISADAAMAGALKARLSGLITQLGYIEAPKAPAVFAECPNDWTAFQVGLFDNGPQKGSRGRTMALKTQYALSLKAWTDDDPKFGGKANYTSSSPLWSASFAASHILKLHDAERITDETLSNVTMLIDGLGSDWLFGIAVNRAVSRGTRYGAVVAAVHITDGLPDDMMIIAANNAFKCPFVDRDAAGKPLSGGAIGMARVARIDGLDQWASHVE